MEEEAHARVYVDESGHTVYEPTNMSEGVNCGMDDYIRCPKCGRVKRARIGFFSKRDHSREPVCKECLTMFIDNTDRTTFEWILEKFDVPYIEKKWVKIYNAGIMKKGVVGSGEVLGKYLRLMKVAQYSKLRYKDSERLNYINGQEKNKVDEAARAIADDPVARKMMQELQTQLDEGKITQEQFDTLNPINHVETPETETFLPSVTEISSEKDKEILSQLSQEEVSYLRKKWGSNYKPNQWLYMEELYTQYENQFELTVDRIVALKQLCKLDLEMNECLAIKDYKAYRDLSGQLDMVRKSAKFTEAQNKENSSNYLDSIGELVRFCEEEKGLIEAMPHPDDYPQDKIDYTIIDIKKYIQDLVRGELGLGSLIESYIKKLEEHEERNALDMNISLPPMDTSLEDEDALQQDEAEEWALSLENNVTEEAALLASLGGR